MLLLHGIEHMPSKKNFLPFVMFFLLITSVVGKGRACIWDNDSDMHIEASHDLKLFSDLMSVLGEGLIKAPLKTNHLGCADFHIIHPFCKVGSSRLYTHYFFSERPLGFFHYLTDTEVPLPAPIFISVRSLLI